MKQWPLVASFILFVALCASVAYWAMQVFTPPARPAVAPPPTAQPAPNLEAAAGLFGGRSNVAVASNFQLRGVIYSGNPASSVAILATDGKPPQAIRANAEVIPGVTVKEVHRQYVLLSDGGVIKRVELPDEPKSDASMAVSGRSPTTSVPAAASAPARTAPAAPPRVVVDSPSRVQQAPAPNTGVPQAQQTPQVTQPSAAANQPQQQLQNPAFQGGMPASGGTTMPNVDMGGPSIGYNPAGAAAPSPQQTPSTASTTSMQGGMPAPPIPPTPPAMQSQAMPQSQTIAPSRPDSGLPAPSSQQR